MSLQDNELSCFAIYRSGVRIPYSPRNRKPSARSAFCFDKENREFEPKAPIRAGEDEAQGRAERSLRRLVAMLPGWQRAQSESPILQLDRGRRSARWRALQSIPLGNRSEGTDSNRASIERGIEGSCAPGSPARAGGFLLPAEVERQHETVRPFSLELDAVVSSLQREAEALRLGIEVTSQRPSVAKAQSEELPLPPPRRAPLSSDSI